MEMEQKGKTEVGEDEVVEGTALVAGMRERFCRIAFYCKKKKINKKKLLQII